MNCGSKDHLSRDCTHPQVDKDKRPCFKCGKPGHVSSQCKEDGAAKLVEEPETHMFGCVICEPEGSFSEVKRRGKPVPSQITLKDFMVNCKKVRRKGPAVTRGRFAPLGGENDAEQLLSIERTILYSNVDHKSQCINVARDLFLNDGRTPYNLLESPSLG